MQRLETRINGLFLFELNRFGDERGFFMESYKAERYREHGLDVEFVQDNLSCSQRGVLRGIHLQDPQPQGKLVLVPQGKIFDIAVDLREGSPTYGEWEGYVLSAENARQFYIPEGFGHAFVALEDQTIMMYKCTDYYNKATEKSLLWNDSDLAVNWSDYIDLDNLIISEKDQAGLTLKSLSAKAPM